MIKLTLLCVMLCPFFSQTLCAQKRQLGLKEMFEIADEKSKYLESSRWDVKVAEEALRAAKADFYPDVDISFTGSYNGDGYCWDRDFTNGFRVAIPHWGNDFVFQAAQVIYSGGRLRSSREMAKLNHSHAQTRLKSGQQEIRLFLSGYYLDICKLYNQIKVYDHHIDLCGKMIDEAMTKQEHGTALINDKTRYELQLEDYLMQRQRLHNRMRVINLQLNTTLGFEEEMEIIPDTACLNEEITMLSQGEWQNRAMANAPILKEKQTEIAIGDAQERLERSSQLPQIALVARDCLNGPITVEVPPLNNNLNYWLVGISIRYSLSSTYKSKNKIRAAKFANERNKELLNLSCDKLRDDVQEAYINFGEALEEMRTQEKKIELATQNYAIVKNRYLHDIALLTDMIDAGVTKLSSELDRENARMDVLYKYMKLCYVCGVL